MKFLEFLLYFIASHLVYSILMMLFSILFQYINFKRQTNKMKKMIDQAKDVSISDKSDKKDGTWH